MEYEKLLELCAELAHEANRAYTELLHEPCINPCWDEAPEDMKESVRAGVNKHLNNPGMTAEESHNAWVAFKKSQGWKWGPEKDNTAKTHPCLVPFCDLNIAQRFKDYLFASVVTAVRRKVDK